MLAGAEVSPTSVAISTVNSKNSNVSVTNGNHHHHEGQIAAAVSTVIVTSLLQGNGLGLSAIHILYVYMADDIIPNRLASFLSCG